MIIDARELPDGTALSAQLCIIGGGMAAITIARELRGTGIDLLILEGGGETPTPAAQTLYRGSATMRDPDGRTRDMTDYLPASRVRAFGGSGHVWGGKCGRLDPTDFELREWIAESGWPFPRETLDPFYDRASRHLELPAFTRDLIGGDAARPAVRVGDGRTWETVPRFHSMVSGAHSREKFDAFRYGITNVPAIRVCLNANVTQIHMTADGRAVASLDVKTLDGKRHRATAEHFILATGGLENARLLLHSGGLGNQHGVVGAYFGGHMNASAAGGDRAPTSGIAFANLTTTFDLYTETDLAKVWGIWNATPMGQRRLRLPNVWVAFTSRWYAATASETAVQRLARASSGASGNGRTDFVPVRIMAEQPPTRSSRVTLDETARDELGIPRLHLDWVLSEAYVRGLERSAAALARDVAAARMGRVRWPLSRAEVITSVNPARHHLGTTRMHGDPRKGVVDEHCRMHGVRNLSIAGSSVFPTPGIVNPTLTITALAIRLADRMRRTFERHG